MKHRILASVPVAALVIGALTAGSVEAQNFTRRPAFGTLKLSPNFAPDPTS